jgi:CheY-like chemotaxis protein
MNLDQSAPVVLIVEAKGLIRSTISKEFQRAGWSVLEASTGEGSLVLAARGPQVDAVAIPCMRTCADCRRGAPIGTASCQATPRARSAAR